MREGLAGPSREGYLSFMSMLEASKAPERVLEYAEECAGVRAFCDRHQLWPQVASALNLVQECFGPVEGPSLRVRRDPEDDAEWLLIRVLARGTPEALGEAYRAYVRRWVAEQPLPQRDMVRLSYGPAYRMQPFDFLQLAQRLAQSEPNPAGLRSAISRAYYAASLTAVDFLGRMNLSLTEVGRHQEVARLLGNTGDAEVNAAGTMLAGLRSERITADSGLTARAAGRVACARCRPTEAGDIIATLSTCRTNPARFAALAQATRAWANALRGLPGGS